MVLTRQPGFKFEEEDPPEIDWDGMSEEEVNEALKRLDEQYDEEAQAIKRCNQLLPQYAQDFIERYLQFDHQRVQILKEELTSILNYLEFGFEVDLDRLEKFKDHSGIVEFSTGNYPYGGMERFLIVLKAFDLIPTGCFNGFTIYQFDWISDFEHNAIELPEKTKEYIKRSRG